MSTLVINGRPFAAGLYWLERSGPVTTARAARRFARPWCVHRAGQTGYAGGTEDDATEGLPALALALVDSIESEFWMALVAGDAAPGDSGGSGRFALTKVRDGAVLADGDEVFSNRDAAVEAFTRARTLGWDLYATPGLLAGGADRDVTELDVSSLAAAPENVLRRAPFTRLGRAHLALALLLPAAVAGMWTAWLQRDALLDWIAGPEPVVAASPPTAPDLVVAVDSVALIEACRRALIDYPPWLPAWRIESLTCAARFSDPELAGLRPELAGRAVMLARWRLAPGHAEPLHRQLAEQHLSRWYAASVVDARAGRSSRWPPCCASSRPSRPYSWRFAVLSTASLAFEGRGSTTSAARGVAGPSGSSIPARCRALPINSAFPAASLVSRSPGWIAAWMDHGACMAAPWPRRR